MIINLTQHAATADQIDAGVVDVADRERLSVFLTIRIGGPDGLASMSPDVADGFLRAIAGVIVEEFVLPAVAQAAREQFAAVTDNPLHWGDTRALNARTMPRVQVMVGGFAPLMDVLIPMLKERGADPLHALSDRVSVDETQPDGSVVKRQVFKHLGFYPAK